MQAVGSGGNNAAAATAAAGNFSAVDTAPVDTEGECGSPSSPLRSNCGYLQWRLEEPLLQNWGFSVSLLSSPAHHRRLRRASAAAKAPPARPGGLETPGRVAPEDSLHSSALPDPSRRCSCTGALCAEFHMSSLLVSCATLQPLVMPAHCETAYGALGYMPYVPTAMARILTSHSA